MKLIKLINYLVNHHCCTNQNCHITNTCLGNFLLISNLEKVVKKVFRQLQQYANQKLLREVQGKRIREFGSGYFTPPVPKFPPLLPTKLWITRLEIGNCASLSILDIHQASQPIRDFISNLCNSV